MSSDLFLARWRRDEPAREFLYAGCNLITTPYLTSSRLFRGIEIRGGLDYCCGEMLFRMGLYEAVGQVARRLSHSVADRNTAAITRPISMSVEKSRSNILATVTS